MKLFPNCRGLITLRSRTKQAEKSMSYKVYSLITLENNVNILKPDCSLKNIYIFLRFRHLWSEMKNHLNKNQKFIFWTLGLTFLITDQM